MEESRKGTCKHGEFDLMEGCPQCIAERQEFAQARKNPVKVKYYSESTGQESEREYTYLSMEPLEVGWVVQVPVRDRVQKAIVTAVNVPESEFAAYLDKVKIIPSGSRRPGPESLFDVIEEETVFNTNNPENGTISKEKPVHGPRQCDTPHLRDYPDCFKECEKEECDGIPFERPGPLPESQVGGPNLFAGNAPGPDFPTEEEVTFEMVDELTADIPPALTTIQNHVGQPLSGLFQLYQQAASLHDFAKTRVIATNADLKPATDDLAIILNCRKAMEVRKSEILGPLKAQVASINQAFNDLMFPVIEADRLTREKVKAYDAAQRAKAVEAARIEEEKNRLAREEAALKEGEITVPLGTAEAAPPPERVRTEMGTLAGRDNWKARIVDFALLPDDYKLPDMQTLNAKARTSKGTAVIPGVEFWNDRIVTVRGK